MASSSTWADTADVASSSLVSEQAACGRGAGPQRLSPARGWGKGGCWRPPRLRGAGGTYVIDLHLQQLLRVRRPPPGPRCPPAAAAAPGQRRLGHGRPAPIAAFPPRASPSLHNCPLVSRHAPRLPAGRAPRPQAIVRGRAACWETLFSAALRAGIPKTSTAVGSTTPQERVTSLPTPLSSPSFSCISFHPLSWKRRMRNAPAWEVAIVLRGMPGGVVLSRAASRLWRVQLSGPSRDPSAQAQWGWVLAAGTVEQLVPPVSRGCWGSGHHVLAAPGLRPR